MSNVTISQKEYDSLLRDSQMLKNLPLYEKLLAFEKSISEKGEYTREELGF